MIADSTADDLPSFPRKTNNRCFHPKFLWKLKKVHEFAEIKTHRNPNVVWVLRWIIWNEVEARLCGELLQTEINVMDLRGIY